MLSRPLVETGWRSGAIAIAFRAIALAGTRLGHGRGERERDERMGRSKHRKSPTWTAASGMTLSQALGVNHISI
jgi:hypothetical protein